MAYRADAPMPAQSSVICFGNLGDDEVQEIDLVARRLLGDRALLHIHYLPQMPGMT
jgi:hypothetical protein